MGATIDDIPLDKRLADINLTTDDETHSELKLTDVEQSIAQVKYPIWYINMLTWLYCRHSQAKKRTTVTVINIHTRWYHE